MLEAYEDIYIGDFIFYLGYLAGKKNRPLNNKNILWTEKTSEQTTVGDILEKWGGRNYIFEFKRTEPMLQSELQKEHNKALLEALLQPENKEALIISNKLHFMCFGTITEEKAGDLAFLPFSGLQACLNDKNPEKECFILLQKFCEKLLGEPDNEFGANYQELRQYFAFIDQLHKKIGYYRENKGEQGIILNICQDNMINLLPFNDVDLFDVALDHPVRPDFDEYSSNNFSVG